VENAPFDYYEGLVRWYELRDRLDHKLTLALQQCDDAADGCCSDCARYDKRWEYAELKLCRVCLMGRIKVKLMLAEQSRTLERAVE